MPAAGNGTWTTENSGTPISAPDTLSERSRPPGQNNFSSLANKKNVAINNSSYPSMSTGALDAGWARKRSKKFLCSNLDLILNFQHSTISENIMLLTKEACQFTRHITFNLSEVHIIINLCLLPDSTTCKNLIPVFYFNLIKNRIVQKAFMLIKM